MQHSLTSDLCMYYFNLSEMLGNGHHMYIQA